MTSVEENPARRLPTPAELTAWLETTGWVRLGATDLSALYAQGYAEGAAQLLVPVRAELDDYEPSVRAVLAKVALLTGRAYETLSREVVSGGRDVVAIRSETDVSGVISLPEGANMWSSARSLLLASASAAVAPRPAYGPLRPDAAEAYIETVDAAVVAGSFVVVLSCPTEPDMRSAVLGRNALPYGRVVTEGLVRSVRSTIETASDSARRSKVGAWSDLVSEGVSADLIDALLQVSPRSESDSARELAIDFSPTIARPSARIELIPGVQEHLAAGAEQLRQSVKALPATVRGSVVGLERRQRGGTQFTVSGFIGFHQTGRSSTRLKVTITADIDERLPIAAYADRSDLILEGEVKRRGRSWIMSSVTAVQVAPAPREREEETPFPGL